MKSNKGFTLIELLAVIVILAIIALIATPTILGVIETARKGSAESSALGYIDAIEKQYAIDMLEEDANKVITVTDGKVTIPDGGITGLDIKGQDPEDGTINFDVDKGIITTADLHINLNGKDYCVHYDSANSTKPATATAMESADEACPKA